jgi:mycothiol synthase
MHPSRSDLKFAAIARHQQREAIDLLVAQLEPREAIRQRAAMRAQCAADPMFQLWAACRDERIVGAMRVWVQRGGTAVVSSPELNPLEPRETALTLFASALERLPAQGVQLAQALAAIGDSAAQSLLIDGGFRHASDLLYLVSLSGVFPHRPPAAPLEFVRYSPALHAALVAAIEASYADSLDCQAVDGLRSIEDVLAGYRAADVLDAAEWYLVRHDGADVGCLLLSSDPDSEAWELTYMGVARGARRRGLGRAIVQQAQWLARQAEQKRLVLAVDAVNTPAIEMYFASGFVEHDRRAMFLRVF